MSQLMAEGTYPGCRIISAVLATSEFGEQVVIDAEVTQGVKRQVYLSMSEETIEGGHVPFKDFTVPVLEFLGFNGDFGAIAFAKTDGVELYCKHKANKAGELKERWYVNTGRFAAEPAARDVTSRANARYKAYSGGARPSGAPKAPPARTASPAPSRAPAAPAPAFDKDKAWEAWAASPIKENKESVTRFYQTIEGMGKPEESFTADDWKKVAAAAETPF